MYVQSVIEEGTHQVDIQTKCDGFPNQLTIRNSLSTFSFLNEKIVIEVTNIDSTAVGDFLQS